MKGRQCRGSRLGSSFNWALKDRRALRWCPGGFQGPLSYVLQQVRGRASSLTCLPIARGGGEGVFPHPCNHMTDERDRVRSSTNSHTLRVGSPGSLPIGSAQVLNWPGMQRHTAEPTLRVRTGKLTPPSPLPQSGQRALHFA